jgi:molecular chaperone GrpE
MGQGAPEPDTPGAAREAVVDTGIEVEQASTTAAAAGNGTRAPSVEAQRDEYYDLLLRKTAEFDNYRKRVEREKRELSDHVVGEFVKELLPVLDDFARALATPADAQGFRSGVELIHRRLTDLLSRRGVEVIDPLGQPFDPHFHEAVQRVPAAGAQDGEVVEVYSRGYKLRDRLLRPAIVKVAIA